MSVVAVVLAWVFGVAVLGKTAGWFRFETEVLAVTRRLWLARVVAGSVLVAEASAALLLVSPLRSWGGWLSAGLFTMFIGYLLIFSRDVGCSCLGGSPDGDRPLAALWRRVAPRGLGLVGSLAVAFDGDRWHGNTPARIALATGVLLTAIALGLRTRHSSVEPIRATNEAISEPTEGIGRRNVLLAMTATIGGLITGLVPTALAPTPAAAATCLQKYRECITKAGIAFVECTKHTPREKCAASHEGRSTCCKRCLDFCESGDTDCSGLARCTRYW